MSIENKPSILNDATINVNRNAIEHRATWMGLIYDEARKAGYDAEAICRKAIYRCGLIHGDRNVVTCEGNDDLDNFCSKAFMVDPAKTTFEMEKISASHDDMKVNFHYCPLVNAWLKLGFDDKTIELLCDIAMDGDRGIAKAMGAELELSETIAKGCPTCKIHFHR